uniref:DUF6538 domain-containing protein n=1 Tax=Pseudomonas amygdali TaxID=47877 RepID=UPI0001CC3F7C
YFCSASLAVPVDVQQKLGCKVLVQSLKTGMRGEAMTRRLPILHEWKTLIAKARAGTPLPDGWQDSVAAVAQQLDTLRRDNKRALIGEPVDALMQPDPGFADFVEKLRAAPRVGEPLIQLLLDAQDKGLSAQLQPADSIADALKRLIPERFAKHYHVTADQVAEMNQLAAYPKEALIYSIFRPGNALEALIYLGATAGFSNKSAAT